MAKEKKKLTENNESQDEMGFLDHLEELRKRIIYAVLALVICCIFTGIFINKIMDLILLGPAARVGLLLQNLRPFGQPFLYFKIILLSGLILSIPLMLYQLWKFIAPGLYSKERSWVRVITFFTSLCFFTGIAFSYFVMIPSMLAFAASFGTDKIKNQIDVNEYLSFITMILLASGILFEMPMVSYVLSRVGILKPNFLSKYRRHSIVVILIIAAVATPTPDPISQLIFAAPLFVLYEISIVISRIASKKKKKEELNAETE
ncbi:MAG: twin-arginine translocase subunit TatC [Candidatus Kapabacteria bacterium]|nr:twin-arginine translocase subunit TatC [Candidatus Kapabacteria bacterium]